jgi:hypothetical protein
MSMDPERGPLSDSEFRILLESLRTVEAPAIEKAAIMLCRNSVLTLAISCC